MLDYEHGDHIGVLFSLVRHRQQRLLWARQHVRWNQAKWANVLFTDESRFNLGRAVGRTMVYRRRLGRFAVAYVVEVYWFGGGSMMLWVIGRKRADERTDGQNRQKQCAPDLSIWGHKDN